MFHGRHNVAGKNTSVDPAGWLDAPPETWPSRIAIGLLLPALLLPIGIYCMVTRHAVMIGRGWHQLHGPPAAAFGLAVIGAGIFLHAHAFWGPVHRLAIIHQIGRLAGALMFVVSFVYVLWAMLWTT